MDFTIDFNASHLVGALESVRRKVEYPNGLLGSAGETLLNINSERHAQGLDPEGKPWEPLAASTLAAGNRKGGPLNKTHRMLENFHYQVHADNLRLGFDSGDGFKAIFHQDGSRAHGSHPGLPARPLVGFPDTDRYAVEDVVEDYLQQPCLQARR